MAQLTTGNPRGYFLISILCLVLVGLATEHHQFSHASPTTSLGDSQQTPDAGDDSRSSLLASPATGAPEGGDSRSGGDMTDKETTSPDGNGSRSGAEPSDAGDSKSGDTGDSDGSRSTMPNPDSGDSKSGDADDSGASKSGDTSDSGDSRSGEQDSGDSRSGDQDSGDSRSGDQDSGDSKSSDVKDSSEGSRSAAGDGDDNGDSRSGDSSDKGDSRSGQDDDSTTAKPDGDSRSGDTSDDGDSRGDDTSDRKGDSRSSRDDDSSPGDSRDESIKKRRPEDDSRSGDTDDGDSSGSRSDSLDGDEDSGKSRSSDGTSDYQDEEGHSRADPLGGKSVENLMFRDDDRASRVVRSTPEHYKSYRHPEVLDFDLRVSSGNKFEGPRVVLTLKRRIKPIRKPSIQQVDSRSSLNNVTHDLADDYHYHEHEYEHGEEVRYRAKVPKTVIKVHDSSNLGLATNQQPNLKSYPHLSKQSKHDKRKPFALGPAQKTTGGKPGDKKTSTPAPPGTKPSGAPFDRKGKGVPRPWFGKKTTSTLAPAKGTSTTSAPAKGTSTTSPLGKSSPSTSAPGKGTPTTSAPVKGTPTTSAPVKGTPTTSAPTKGASTTKAPVKLTPPPINLPVKATQSTTSTPGKTATGKQDPAPAGSTTPKPNCGAAKKDCICDSKEMKDTDKLLAVVLSKSGAFKGRRINVKALEAIMKGKVSGQELVNVAAGKPITVSADNSYVFPAGHYYFAQPIRFAGLVSP